MMLKLWLIVWGTVGQDNLLVVAVYLRGWISEKEVLNSNYYNTHKKKWLIEAI